jgi:hypothetical protein
MNKDIKLLNYRNVKKNKYHYNIPYKTEQGSYLASCVYKLDNNDKKCIPFYFETPKLKTISGIYKNNGKFYIDLEIPLSEDYVDFYNFIELNDEINIISCNANCNEWFGKNIPLDIIKSYYKSSLILRTNKTPILRAKLPSFRGKIIAEIFNQNKELVDASFISPDDTIVSIIELSGLEIFNKEFLGEYEVQKIKVFKGNREEKKIPSGYIFSDKKNINLNNLPTTNNIAILEDKNNNYNQNIDNNTPCDDIIDIESSDNIKDNTDNNDDDDDDDNQNDAEETRPFITEKTIIIDRPIIPREKDNIIINKDISYSDKQNDNSKQDINEVTGGLSDLTNIKAPALTKRDFDLASIDSNEDDSEEYNNLDDDNKNINIDDDNDNIGSSDEIYSDSEYEIDDEDLLELYKINDILEKQQNIKHKEMSEEKIAEGKEKEKSAEEREAEEREAEEREAEEKEKIRKLLLEKEKELEELRNKLS